MCESKILIYEDKASMNSDYWVMIQILDVVRGDEADQIGGGERRANQVIEKFFRLSALKYDLRDMGIFITVMKCSTGREFRELNNFTITRVHLTK